MKRMFLLRDSLSYRAEAVLWHAHLIGLLQTAGIRRLRETYPDDAKEQQLLFQIGCEHFYVFDNLVFNALSMFDYVGNVIGFAFYGEQRRKAKWDRIQRFARDPDYERRSHSTPRVSGSTVGACVLEVDASLVSALTGFRAALIHYEALVGPGELVTRYGSSADGGPAPDYELTFRVPEVFAQSFTVPGYEGEPAKAPLVEAANWLAQEATRQSLRILRELERELRSEAGYAPDGTDGSVEIVA
jgi:hypothetical protein